MRMPRPLPNLIARLHRVSRPREAGDGDALTNFARTHNPDAFAHLVRRFGPMVQAVCRRQLGDTPDADDAYQATFLVLVRKARTVRPPDAVGSWLFAVAHRTAVYARAVMHRRAAKLRPLDIEPATTPPVPSDLMTALDSELANLPDKFRDAVVLCELDGKTLKEAADAVGVPVGTLASRLARGRQLLADRLKAKGFAVTAAAVSGVLASAGISAATPEFNPSAVAPTVGSTQLANKVMKMALLSKLKLTTTVVASVLTVGVFGVNLLPGPTPVPAAHAAPVPKNDGQPTTEERKALDDLWNKLGSTQADSTEAAFLLVKHSRAMAYLKGRLKPLKMDEKEAKTLLAKLFGEEEDMREAEKELTARSPLLAMPIKALWAEAKTNDERRRLARVLGVSTDNPQIAQAEYGLQEELDGSFLIRADTIRGGRVVGGTVFSVCYSVAEGKYDPRWRAERRAVYVLEQIGTPEAVKVIEEMATGHPEAGPTKTAKTVLERLKKK